MLKLLSQAGHKVAGILHERTEYGVEIESPSLKLINQYLSYYPISSLLPYRSYDPVKEIFHNESSVGFVLETYPMIGCTEEMQREISGLFQHTLPEGSHIQFILWADPRIGHILNYWRSVRDLQRTQDSSSGIFQKLAERRTSFLNEKVFQSNPALPNLCLRDFRCIVAYSQRGIIDNPVEEQKLLDLREQVKTALKTLGMPLKTWNANDLLNTLDGLINYYSSTNPSDLKWNPFDSLDLQIPSSRNSLQITKDFIAINETESIIRTYSVRREPDQWSLHAMGDLIGDPLRDLLQIPYPFMIHYGIHICDQERTKMRIQSRESWVENQARSKIGKRIPILLKQSRELDFVRYQQSKGERFIQTSFMVTLFCPKEKASHADQVLVNLFRSKRWQLQADSYIQLPNFLSTLPMNWGEGMTQDLYYLQKLKTTLSTESANLLPLQGEWKGTPSPGMLLVGRRGQIFTWSPFDNQEGNYNVSVVGKSGSGKSVFMQELVASTLGQGGQVFVLDVGRSFEKTVKLLGGEYIEFTPRSSICINPFTSLPVDNEAESEDALAMLKPILSLMAAPREGTGDLENSFIEQVLKAAWDRKKREASITDVADHLTDHPEPLAKNLGQKLFPYTKDGIYGRFFNGPATVDLSAAMVVVELEELKERKDLQEVIVQMIIVQITNKLYLGDRKTPSHVVLDEAWDMLRGRQSGTFIETAARRLRKYRGSLVVGTQSVNDFYASPAAQAAFENSDWMCLLAQKPESIKQLKESKRISMDPTMEAMLTSVKTKQGQYAEVMIYGPHGYAIGRLLLDPFSLILYSTKAEEFAAVQALTNRGMELAEAIEQVSQRRET
ncbi:MAG: type-IV secretion system protein TraC [Alphaproteobacteria bacterium 41-28]|nr:MAG: type-IV secretion system protein TraC [Alphaproteobacteria bacterium 41-28]